MNKNSSSDYEKYMQRCIELAKLSYGQVSPNPLVGAVLLDKDGKFAAEGRHEKYGFAHAEVNAVKNAKEKNINLEGGTIIVNLEPCSHYGKTPPCADLIIENKIKKVIIGCVDPNPKVAGNGIKKLQESGIEVVQGVLENECRALNEIFFKNQTEKRVFSAIKTATTMDGKIATKTGSSKWITSQNARNAVQELRNKYDAILTGSNTILADNPSLTCRLENGKGRNPVRIVVDSHLKTLQQEVLPQVYNDDGTRRIVATLQTSQTEQYEKLGLEFIKCPALPETQKPDLNYLYEKLYESGICSVLVETGGILNGEILKRGLAEKVYQFVAPKITADKDAKGFAQGFDLTDINNSLKLEIKSVQMYPPDIMIEAYVLKNG